MADVVRFSTTLEEVLYSVGPDTVRRAILDHLEAEHGGSFTSETEIRFSQDGSAAVVTVFRPRTDATKEPLI